jgi:hypothetical protein
MLIHTRRRALGLLVAACAGTRFMPAVPRAFAQNGDSEESNDSGKPECFDSKDFGRWKAQASDSNAGASLSDAPKVAPCDLSMNIQVNTRFDAKIFLTGDPDKAPLPEEFLIKPENRLIAKTADGKVVVDEALCGNCTDIYDDQVSIVLPLATAPLFRDENSVELAIRLTGKKDDCRFKLDAATLRKALDWATERRDALAKEKDNDECVAPEGGCFITTACCAVIGLPDDCFELRTLRRYRDEVLAKTPDGHAQIARYYAEAPHILASLARDARKSERVLLSVYARFVLPAALAAKFGLNELAYGLYTRMLAELADPGMTTGAEAAASTPVALNPEESS